MIPARSEYPTPQYTLHKTAGPALLADALGEIDAVLLSHDAPTSNGAFAAAGMNDRLRWSEPGAAIEVTDGPR